MKYQENEELVKVFYHHPMAWFLREARFMAISLPFYFLAAVLSTGLTTTQSIYVFGGITLIFALIIGLHSLFYLMDRLIITSQRIVHVDWQGPFKRMEHEAEIVDVQDIETEETGVLSFLPIFDYGTFTLETASAHTTITFREAPDPEGIKHFIYHLSIKPNRIGSRSLRAAHDKARENREDAATVTRRQ